MIDMGHEESQLAVRFGISKSFFQVLKEEKPTLDQNISRVHMAWIVDPSKRPSAGILVKYKL
jgi:hypothetical protein